MKTVVKKLYEAMFLVDSAQAASDWDGVNKVIKTILGKSDAEIVSMRKWDERKLTYGIQGHSRGTYILCYFRVDGKKIRDIERDIQLSERVMRVLILSAESISQADIEKDTPVSQAEKQREKAAAEAAESEESFKAEEAKESFDASAFAADESLEAASMKTEEADAEETDEPESAPAENEQEEKEKDAEVSR